MGVCVGHTFAIPNRRRELLPSISRLFANHVAKSNRSRKNFLESDSGPAAVLVEAERQDAVANDVSTEDVQRAERGRRRQAEIARGVQAAAVFTTCADKPVVLHRPVSANTRSAFANRIGQLGPSLLVAPSDICLASCVKQLARSCRPRRPDENSLRRKMAMAAAKRHRIATRSGSRRSCRRPQEVLAAALSATASS
jgi:hypothetical protein